ncbi:hypothetical protein CLF_101442 [Clonorchis sinensis]|uniref:Uncharacterized protein n=1 Tax=Clonorchis sinensis TaxID=79923 RepID=G7Y5S0_CLOSI|nr:hypothetical protein CLF_101442 [Clonorchis sinensis]
MRMCRGLCQAITWPKHGGITLDTYTGYLPVIEVPTSSVTVWVSLENGLETRPSHLYDCLIEDVSLNRAFQQDGEETMLDSPTDATTVRIHGWSTQATKTHLQRNCGLNTQKYSKFKAVKVSTYNPVCMHIELKKNKKRQIQLEFRIFDCFYGWTAIYTSIGGGANYAQVSADLRNRLSIDNLAAAISQSTPAQLPMSDHSDQQYDNVYIDKLAGIEADTSVNGQSAYTERDPEGRQSEDFILTKVRFSQVGSKPPGCSTSPGSLSASDTKRSGDLDTCTVPSFESAVLSSPDAGQPPTNYLSDTSTNQNAYVSERDAGEEKTTSPEISPLVDKGFLQGGEICIYNIISRKMTMARLSTGRDGSRKVMDAYMLLLAKPPVRFTLADYFDRLNNTSTTPKPLLPRLVVPAPKVTGLQTPVEKALMMSHSTSLDDVSDSLLNPGGNGSESVSSSVTFGHIPMDAVDYLVKRRSFLLICLAERYEELIRLLDEELELTGQPPENYNQYMHDCHDAQAAAKRLRAPEPAKTEEDGSRSSDLISLTDPGLERLRTGLLGQRLQKTGFPISPMNVRKFSMRVSPSVHSLRQTSLLSLSDQEKPSSEGLLPPVATFPQFVKNYALQLPNLSGCIHQKPSVKPRSDNISIMWNWSGFSVSKETLCAGAVYSMSETKVRGVVVQPRYNPSFSKAFDAERSHSFSKQGEMLDSHDLRDSKCSEQYSMSRKAPVGRESHIKSTSMSDIYSGVRESWMDANESEESSNSVATVERDALSSTDRESSFQEAVVAKGEAENGEGRDSEVTWINVELEALRNIMEVNLRLAADSKRKEASRKAYRLAARQNEQAINQLEEQRRILLGLPSVGKETTPSIRRKGEKPRGNITRKSGNARSASEVRISTSSDSLNRKTSGQSKLGSSSTENGTVRRVLLPAPTNSVMYDGLVHTAPMFSKPTQSKPDVNSSLNVNRSSASTASMPEPDEERSNRMGTSGILPADTENDSKEQNSLISDPQAASSPIQNPCVRRLARTPFPKKEQTAAPDTDHSDDGRDSGRSTLFQSSPHTCDDSKDTYSTENRTSVDSQDSTCSPTPGTYRGNNATPVSVRRHTIQTESNKGSAPSPGPFQFRFENENSPVDYRMPTQEAFMYSRLPAYNNGGYPTRTDGYELPGRRTFEFSSHIPYEVEVKKATPPYPNEPYFSVAHRVMPSIQMRPAHQAVSAQELYGVSSVSGMHVLSPDYNKPPPYPSLQAQHFHPNPQNFNVGSRSRTPDPMLSATRGIRPVEYGIRFEPQHPSESDYYPNTTYPGYDPLPHSLQPLYYDRTHFAMPTRSSPSFWEAGLWSPDSSSFDPVKKGMAINRRIQANTHNLILGARRPKWLEREFTDRKSDDINALSLAVHIDIGNFAGSIFSIENTFGLHSSPSGECPLQIPQEILISGNLIFEPQDCSLNPMNGVVSSDSTHLVCTSQLVLFNRLSNKSWLYGSEASVFNTDVMLSMMMTAKD